MASPKIEVFAVYHITTGALLTGQAGLMSFLTYTDDLGNAVAAPSISEIGSTGLYKFTPTFPVDTNRGVVYVVNTGTNGNPTRQSRFIRPEDWATDSISTLVTDVALIKKIETGKWQIHTSGADVNRLVIYDTDGTTVLVKFDLVDAAGIPTTTNPYKRSPA